MAHIDSHAPGSICWIELGTTDQSAAKQFYSALFGWQTNDFPMVEDRTYSMCQLEGRDAAAIYTMCQSMLDGGLRPHWLIYISVDSADEASVKVAQLGGKVLNGPTDVSTFGRMAVVQDPGGAAFALWEARSHHGTRITGTPGTLCWADLPTRNLQQVKDFYSALFGWEFAGDPSYLHASNRGQMFGGLMPMGKEWGDVPSHWMPYFLAGNCDAATEQAKSLGAECCVPPNDIPNTGRFSVITDAQGAVFSLFSATAQAATQPA